MFTRHVIMELKPNTTTEFTNVVESKILPLLRKQKGFRDEMTFVAPDRSEAIAISFWDTKEEAEAYKARVVAQAQGDAQRFKSVFAEYQKAPQVTRDRMYLDTMQQIYGNVTKVLVDSKQGSNLLYLPLDKIMQISAAGGDAAAAASPVAPPAVHVVPAPGSGSDARSREAARTRDRESR